MKTKILVLGHAGMLGSMAVKHFSAESSYEVCTLSHRYGDPFFWEEISSLHPHVIVNCIGYIPQKASDDGMYWILNFELPQELDRFGHVAGIRVVYPTTDCEFDGGISRDALYQKYDERNAQDVYGKSKIAASMYLLNHGRATHVIRVSIIGFDVGARSLLSWYLSQTGSVRGYTHHMWNGITTKEWAKQCQYILETTAGPGYTQLASPECVSKHELLSMIRDAHGSGPEITPVGEHEVVVNKCLKSDYVLPPLSVQLRELFDARASAHTPA